jgi:hypothetical protein
MPGAPLLAVKRGDLAVDKSPVDLLGQLRQFVLQVDDLIQSRPEQIVRTRGLVLLRPHRAPPVRPENHPLQMMEIPKTKRKLLRQSATKPCNVKTAGEPKIDSCSTA